MAGEGVVGGRGITLAQPTDLDSYVELWQFDELAIKLGDLCTSRPWQARAGQVGVRVPQVCVRLARCVCASSHVCVCLCMRLLLARQKLEILLPTVKCTKIKAQSNSPLHPA